MDRNHSHRIYRLTEWVRQAFAVATLGALMLVQPLRQSALEGRWAAGTGAESAATKTVGTSNREFASGPSAAVGRPITRGGQS